MAVQPFSISPNPLAVFLTDAVRTVLNKVRFVVNDRQGMTVILGDVGLGKSSLLRILEVEFGERPDVKSISLPTPEFKGNYAFTRAICSELGLPMKRSLSDQLHALQSALLKQYEDGKTVVLLVDEAQKLKPDMLELCRSLLNFETYEEKLIQIVLAGQLELRDALLDNKNKALYSRVFAPSLLAPLTLEETTGVINHRCQFYGITNPFTPEAIRLIYTETGGVPRSILMLCAEAYAFVRGNGSLVTPELVRELAAEGIRQ